MSDYCGVDCEIIRLLADKLCSTTKAVLSVYTGIEYQRSAVQNYRAIQILWAITGKYDVEGGMYINGDHFPTVKLKKSSGTESANRKQRISAVLWNSWSGTI